MSHGLHVHADRARALAGPPERVGGGSGAGVLATCVLASSLAFIDGSVVNVGLPAVGHSLGADGAGLAWVVNGYLLPLGALLLLGGAGGDLYGRRLLLMAGTALFAVASVVCAAAPDLAWLVGGRVAQGVGAAMLMPNSLAILGASFGGEARGRAVGIWAATGAAAAAVGPLIGGWLIDALGWRAMFFVNIPIAAAALAMAARFVRPGRDGDGGALDLPGGALATAGLGSLTWGLTEAGAGWSVATVWAVLAGVALLGLFILAEHRRGARAMMPLAMFGSATFIGLSVMTFLLYGALGGLMVLVPYVLIELLGYSATGAGAAVLPVALVIALMSPLMGRLAGRIGPRLPLTVGPVVVAAGLVLAARMPGGGSYWTGVLPAMLVIAVGMAGAVAPLTTAVLASVEPQHTGVASGFNSAVARTGGLIATALLGAVLAARGPDLAAGFGYAAFAGAAAALLAAASAWRWL